MLRLALKAILVRDLRAARREIEAFPDDAGVWKQIPGVPNSSGTLALHIAGNVQHFFGAILGGSGYKRDREAEFARRDVPRAELLAGLDAAVAAVEQTLEKLSDAELDKPYPEPIAKRRLSTTPYLLHLCTHLAYHLGQMDYHRRAVTGDGKPVDAVSVRELPEL